MTTDDIEVIMLNEVNLSGFDEDFYSTILNHIVELREKTEKQQKEKTNENSCSLR